MDVDLEIDALGLRCPLPVLRVRKALIGMPPGTVLRLLADDPMAAIDLPHFCAQAGHEYLGDNVAGVGRVYLVRRGPER